MLVSHIQVITSVVKPMATLVLSRKLYLIASLRSVEPPNKMQVNIVPYYVLAKQTDRAMLIEA